jgi:hypothetical protein
VTWTANNDRIRRRRYTQYTSTKPRYIPSQRLRSSRRFNKLSLHRIALESPRASAVELDMFSTKRCLTFFRIKSNVLPWAGSAWSLLYRIVTELQFFKIPRIWNLKLLVPSKVRIYSYARRKSDYYDYLWAAWIILATSDLVLPLTETLSTPIISSPLWSVPSLAAAVLSNI